MAERENTPEDIAQWVAALRGQSQADKAEENRALVSSIHPLDEPEEPQPEEPQTEQEVFVQRLFAPKPGHAEIVRRLHPTESEDS